MPVANLKEITDFLATFPFMAVHCVIDGYQVG
jgi:hypothetical protein